MINVTAISKAKARKRQNNILLWQPVTAVMPQIPPSLLPFIIETGSMTSCLKTLGETFSVSVQYQGLLSIDDPAVLTYMKITELEPVWVRQVILATDEMPVMFAETIMRQAAYQRNKAWLAALGETPIGEYLFQNPALWRTPIAVTRLPSASRYHRLIPEALGLSKMPLWARRSQLSDDKIHLGLFEVFLPGLLHCAAERKQQ